MADQILTAERLREVLHYDPDTGVFTWRVNKGRAKAGDVAGYCNNRGYRQIKLGGTVHSAHRLAWLWALGRWPSRQVDHIDGDRANNRLVNLRDVPGFVNAQNRRDAQVNSRSGVLGVGYRYGRWQAGITLGGKRRHIGTYDTPEQAHAAYVATKRDLHEGCTI